MAIIRTVNLTDALRGKLAELLEKLEKQPVSGGILGNHLVCDLQKEITPDGMVIAILSRYIGEDGIEDFRLRISFLNGPSTFTFESTVITTALLERLSEIVSLFAD